jgi:DNA-binding Lrp family transcriptional regulator
MSSSTPRDDAGAGRSAPANPAPRLDEVDRRMLAELLADGRVSITELAERVGVSRANAYTRFDRLRRDGVVRGFGARIDPRALGLSVGALITVTADQHAWRSLRDDLVAMPEVVYFALTTGEFDLVLLVRAPDIETLRDVVLVRLQTHPAIRATRTILVLDEVVPDHSPLA